MSAYLLRAPFTVTGQALSRQGKQAVDYWHIAHRVKVKNSTPYCARARRDQGTQDLVLRPEDQDVI